MKDNMAHNKGKYYDASTGCLEYEGDYLEGIYILITHISEHIGIKFRNRKSLEEKSRKFFLKEMLY